VFENISSDVRREFDDNHVKGPLASLWIVFMSKSLHVVYVYRTFHAVYGCLRQRRFLWRLSRPFFEVAYRTVAFFVVGLKGIEIPYQVSIGKGLRLVHPFEVVLAPQTVIGENCTIFNGVTCGVNHLDRSGFPRIGDDVTLYPGAKIVGNVSVGNHVIVAPNSVVVKDIEDNCIAGGIPAGKLRDWPKEERIAW